MKKWNNLQIFHTFEATYKLDLATFRFSASNISAYFNTFIL